MMLIFFRSLFVAMTAVFAFFLVKDARKTDFKKESGSVYVSGAIGIVVNFFDALGIGSFATATVLLRVFKQIPDKLLPGTLNVMCLFPTILESFIYMGIIEVEYLTLILMVVAAYIGGWIGARYVSKLPEDSIRFAMAIALFVAGAIILLKQVHLFPVVQGYTIGLTGIKLWIGIAASVTIGSLCSIGIGFFAPFLAVASLLGMSAKSVFPIMMTAAAAASYGSTLTFIKNGAYNRKVAISMAVCGTVGVLLAAYLVKSLPLNILLWLVMCVIFYASVSLFIASGIHKKLFCTTH